MDPDMETQNQTQAKISTNSGQQTAMEGVQQPLQSPPASNTKSHTGVEHQPKKFNKKYARAYHYHYMKGPSSERRINTTQHSTKEPAEALSTQLELNSDSANHDPDETIDINPVQPCPHQTLTESVRMEYFQLNDEGILASFWTSKTNGVKVSYSEPPFTTGKFKHIYMMNFNQDNVNKTYVLKSITSPSDWWLKYGNQQAGIWHEVYRLCDLKLLAESFCSIAKFRSTQIYNFLVLPSYIITAAEGQGKAWIGQPYTSGQVLPVIDTVNLRRETLQAFSHYICQRQDKTCLHTEFQGCDTVQDGLCIFDCCTYTSDEGMPINYHISIFIANHICNTVCHGLNLTPFTS